MNIGNLLICIAGIIWGIELIPQMIKTYKSKNVDGISLLFFSMCLFAYLCYMTGSYLLQQWIILFSHLPSLIFNFTMVCMIIKYKKKKNKTIVLSEKTFDLLNNIEDDVKYWHRIKGDIL